MLQKASLWHKLDNGLVSCDLCFHHCHIPDGEKGFCAVRFNRGGELLTAVADNITGIALDPVEKKPLYHFLPGTKTLSFGTLGCNFACQFCQNYSISRRPADTGRLDGCQVASAEDLVGAAVRCHVPSISFTYNEPTVFFEMLVSTADCALPHGLRTVMVTNGAMSGDCLKALSGRIHAANVDLKSFSEESYRKVCSGSLAPVLRNLATMKAMGWWLEVTTLVVPGMNDSTSELSGIASFIARELGPATPWHISAFFPRYHMLDRESTPSSTLERAWNIGLEAGLHYVYIGNIRSVKGSNTLCPRCGAVCIERNGFISSATNGLCPDCGYRLEGIWS